jgi:hypothetical protein
MITADSYQRRLHPTSRNVGLATVARPQPGWRPEASLNAARRATSAARRASNSS